MASSSGSAARPHGARFVAIPGLRRDAALAQLVLLDLAVLGLRQGVDERDVARHGEIRHPGLAEPDDRLAVEYCARAAHDPPQGPRPGQPPTAPKIPRRPRPRMA